MRFLILFFEVGGLIGAVDFFFPGVLASCLEFLAANPVYVSGSALVVCLAIPPASIFNACEYLERLQSKNPEEIEYREYRGQHECMESRFLLTSGGDWCGDHEFQDFYKRSEASDT